ncbi:PRC-barrel domain-containing protein [Bradyrhizobium xenonodulans]|uniref:PRC-barrel domain-containing protein n=1 Tax=Bradyrhizobium xenonodulans TaxID=2736875 RepID=A0ABY7MQW8_9BRAD|nr:PRC-barrel domain-containing protein [Bradyrhizobium xenonodulans]WBL80749.1 PRC-barrel domain-containing protein [Bradyrhizobium xenonodulans]
MRTIGALMLSVAVVAGLSVAMSRAAEPPTVAPTTPPSEANAPATVPPPASAVPVTPKDAAPPPSVTIIGASDAHGVLGRDVRSAADEDMGRIVDIIVDRTGHVRAAVIDFGGFLGVGSRKIVVDWNAMRFGKIANKKDSITLELTKAQVAAAPEYKEDTPMVVLGASGSLQPLQAIQ